MDNLYTLRVGSGAITVSRGEELHETIAEIIPALWARATLDPLESWDSADDFSPRFEIGIAGMRIRLTDRQASELLTGLLNEGVSPVCTDLLSSALDHLRDSCPE